MSFNIRAVLDIITVYFALILGNLCLAFLHCCNFVNVPIFVCTRRMFYIYPQQNHWCPLHREVSQIFGYSRLAPVSWFFIEYFIPFNLFIIAHKSLSLKSTSLIYHIFSIGFLKAILHLTSNMLNELYTEIYSEICNCSIPVPVGLLSKLLMCLTINREFRDWPMLQIQDSRQSSCDFAYITQT